MKRVRGKYITMLLAIDTSTRYAGVAIVDPDGQHLHLAQWRSQQNHSVELLPTIEALLKRAEATIKDVTAIAAAIGPGSFSALRVGLSVAKGLAWANSLPLVSVTTLEAEALAYASSGMPTCAVLDAGRGQLLWALFQNDDGLLRKTAGEDIAAPEELMQRLPTPALICGEAVEKYGEALAQAAPQGIKLAIPYLPGLRVAALAHLGYARLKNGETQDPAAIQPLYLRRPTITEPKSSGAKADLNA